MNEESEVTVEIPPVHLMEDDFEELDLVENRDYCITEDPRDPKNAEKWAVHILTGEWKDWVITFPEVYIEHGGLEFVYESIFTPELPEDYTVDDHEIADYMGTIIEQIVTSLYEEEGGQVYLDAETGEKIDL